MDYEAATEIFNKVRDIPYRIPLSINEKDNCCSGKHTLLLQELTKLGYECRYKVCSFNWDTLALPDKLFALPHENKSTHVFLEVKIDNDWKTVDATWDKGLSQYLLLIRGMELLKHNQPLHPLRYYPKKKVTE